MRRKKSPVFFGGFLSFMTRMKVKVERGEEDAHRSKKNASVAAGLLGLGAGKRPLALTYIYPIEAPFPYEKDGEKKKKKQVS